MTCVYSRQSRELNFRDDIRKKIEIRTVSRDGITPT